MEKSPAKWKIPLSKMLFQKAFWTAQTFTIMLFYCSYYQNVLATQWVMLMQFSSILKPYKASCARISGVGKPRLLKHLWLLHQTGSESLRDSGLC